MLLRTTAQGTHEAKEHKTKRTPEKRPRGVATRLNRVPVERREDTRESPLGGRGETFWGLLQMNKGGEKGDTPAGPGVPHQAHLQSRKEENLTASKTRWKGQGC